MKKRNYSLKFGLQMFLSIAGFFVLMKVLNLESVTELRYLNILIVAYFSNKLAKNLVIDDNKIEYITGLSAIFAANAFAVVLSIIAFILYSKLIDVNFIHNFKGGIIFSATSEISLGQLMAALFIEGMAGSAIISFTTMQYWKGVKRTTKAIDLNNI